MKRELKVNWSLPSKKPESSHRKAHPDEKGTERTIAQVADVTGLTEIAKPIPMKRELKVLGGTFSDSSTIGDRKAHPDEKGTESVIC